MTERKEQFAFGWPGIEARWTSSAKNGVGTAFNPASKVWYSISHGILNEIYYPQVDQACTRDMEFIVTDGIEFFSEEKRNTQTRIKTFYKGVPGYNIVNTCEQKIYRIEKEIFSDPNRDTLIQFNKFFPSKIKRDQLKLFILLAPHLGNRGYGNNGWIGNYKGFDMLFAQREDIAIAMACSLPFSKRSIGFVGSSDGWQDLYHHKKMMWEFEQARNGNIALCAEIPLEGKVETEFTIVIGFGRNANEAGMRAKASLLENYDKLKSQFNKEWQRWQRKLFIIENGKNSNQLFSLSASILKVHESKRHPGALIASLSIPWGVSKGDDELGGYHLVWPRDLVQTAGGLLAAKANTDAKRVLNYLLVTQEQDGHWCQNMWLDGSPYWRGIQMDQTASPILLVDLIHREITLSKHELNKLWPMIKKAAIYIVHNGPTTEQDRWEENAGFSTYTIAVEISALLIAAEFARNFGEIKLANFLCEVADSWNSRIEDWCYVKNTALARKNNVEGYYVRINTQEGPEKNNEGTDILKISNRVEEDSNCPASEMVSPDALALVRFGLRSANDPKILNTVKVIDNTLQYKGEKGPLWYRYNYDGYGEHADGNPFNGIGIGRPWPLLTGERGHYEVAKGDIQEAEKMLKTLENYAGENCLIPEQIWDSKDILDKELIKDKPSGAAMPLAWAHAEYIKLYRSILSKKIFDMPSICEKRYIKEQNESFIYIVNLNKPLNFLSENKIIRFVYNEKFKINIRTGDNQDQTLDSIHISSNLYYTDLITKNMKADSKLELLIINSKNELPIGQKIFIKIKPEKLKLEDSFAETIDY